MSLVFAGDQPTPAPAADPFSLADPATAGAILAISGFTAVKITGVHEPVYYGPDAASALRGMLSLQMTKALLAPLDAASTRHALSQLRGGPRQPPQQRRRVLRLVRLAHHRPPPMTRSLRNGHQVRARHHRAAQLASQAAT
jgi:hypothetical protein